jgi:DNA-directed RNA polymerase specialized sigma24 family protein
VTPSSSKALSLREESDADLLYYMSCRENPADRRISDAATLEFHRRYAVGLLDRCRMICRQLGSVVEPEDLFEVTLVKSIERAETFVAAVDAASRPARTLNWLAQLARNLHVDALRNPNRSGPLTGEHEAIPHRGLLDAGVRDALLRRPCTAPGSRHDSAGSGGPPDTG